ncbi:UNVERIFIED_CONTAM: hypothetical protein Slati_0993900 [Sesamum latifolium]|uniref:Uncharacterized protein n=1 Tax=Sesamum latifolium TaxID=2727402 RepID=A0AAW2XRE3_9LAMI
MEEKRTTTFSIFFPTCGVFWVLGAEEEGGVPASMAAEAGESLEGPSGGSLGAFSFFPSGFPRLRHPL